jgi:hypothetical protein
MGDDKPNPLNDTIKGLGLLFRAARTVAAKIPTKNLEEVVTTSAREVGRAFENVASTVATSIERGVLGKDAPRGRGEGDERDERRAPDARDAPDAGRSAEPGESGGDSPPPKRPS